MASVNRSTDSSSWRVRWYNPQGIRQVKSFNDKAYGGRANAKLLADQFAITIEADKVRGEYINPKRNKIPLADFKYEVGLVKLNQKETTKATLENIWESYIAPYPIANKQIGSIKGTHISQHIKSLRKSSGEEYSHSTIVKVIEVFRVLLEKAIEDEVIKGKNPATTRVVKDWIPKKEKTKHIYLDKFQVNAIYKQVEKTHPQYAVAIPLLAWTGLRSGEFRALEWTDIDFNKGTISVNKSFTDNASSEKALDPKTDSSNRTIQIDNITLNKLREHKENFYQGICPYVFPNRDCNQPITGRNFKHRVLKPALEELEMDMDINLHTFRHTSVFLARQSGADVLSISKRLGHASISITADTYSALFEETDLELVQGLEKLQQEVI